MSVNLPPRGVWVETVILFSNLAPVVRDTYIQLRAIAFGQSVIPALRIDEFSSITGKSESSVYGHMAALRTKGALRWRTSRDGTIMVEFCELSAFSENLETPVNVNSLILNIDSSLPEGGPGEDLIDSRNLENVSENLETGIVTEKDCESIFREVTGLITFPPLRQSKDIEIIRKMVKELTREITIERMKAAWNAWKQGKRKDNGRNYSLTNTAWLDYALVGEVPGGINISSAKRSGDGSINV